MIQCQNCGQVNNQSSNFCRFCGTKFMPQQFSNGSNYEFSPPRPYVWKTDEFQISESKARKSPPINKVQPLDNPFLTHQNPRPQPLVQQHQQNLAYNYRCPRCSSNLMPRFERKISTAGWIVFAILLVAFFPLFWVGFLIKEDVRVCPVCNLTLD
jgi:RNA polymerase subunit RPABC4/transcription elongation factor Spt4